MKNIACLNIKCARAGKHVKGCIAFGKPYPTKVINYLDDRPGIFDTEPKMKSGGKKIKEKLLVESWYNRSLPYVDLDNPTADGYCNEYQMTCEAWTKSIKKDLKKYYKKL
jgi:hypothetical protein